MQWRSGMRSSLDLCLKMDSPWVRSILPIWFQFEFEKNHMKKYEIEAPFGVPGTSRKEKPTLTGDGINTQIESIFTL